MHVGENFLLSPNFFGVAELIFFQIIFCVCEQFHFPLFIRYSELPLQWWYWICHLSFLNFSNDFLHLFACVCCLIGWLLFVNMNDMLMMIIYLLWWCWSALIGMLKAFEGFLVVNFKDWVVLWILIMFGYWYASDAVIIEF